MEYSPALCPSRNEAFAAEAMAAATRPPSPSRRPPSAPSACARRRRPPPNPSHTRRPHDLLRPHPPVLAAGDLRLICLSREGAQRTKGRAGLHLVLPPPVSTCARRQSPPALATGARAVADGLQRKTWRLGLGGMKSRCDYASRSWVVLFSYGLDGIWTGREDGWVCGLNLGMGRFGPKENPSGVNS
jgi:hypothetical protein